MYTARYRKNINVSIEKKGDTIKLVTEDAVIDIHIQSPIPSNQLRYDFAAWLILPLAMRTNADMIIHGAGSISTANNAKRLSQIWETWMPARFHTVNVTFTHSCEDSDGKRANRELCFYSGGVDSTYSILRLHQENRTPSLLTIQGMDYQYEDNTRFRLLLDKTQPFATKYAQERLYVKTNIYNLYKKYRVNPRESHLSHIFVLAGSAFLFSEHVQEITIAADYTIDQQFAVHPYGSNAATNPLFHDGSTWLRTDSETIPRTDKMPLLLTFPEALTALSFCNDYKFRPNNCGQCDKCMRTKLMFLAATGVIPDIFDTGVIDPHPLKYMKLHKKKDRAFLTDLCRCAIENGRLDDMPYLIPVRNQLKKTGLQKEPRLHNKTNHRWQYH